MTLLQQVDTKRLKNTEDKQAHTSLQKGLKLVSAIFNAKENLIFICIYLLFYFRKNSGHVRNLHLLKV